MAITSLPLTELQNLHIVGNEFKLNGQTVKLARQQEIHFSWLLEKDARGGNDLNRHIRRDDFKIRLKKIFNLSQAESQDCLQVNAEIQRLFDEAEAK